MADRNKSLQSSTRRRHWRLLLIGDRGEIITINRLKGLMIALAVVAVTMFVAAAFFFYTNRQLVVANTTLQTALEQMKSRLISLKNDRDICMARLVAVEFRRGGPHEAKGEKTVPVKPSRSDEDDRPLEETDTAGQTHGESVAVTDGSAPLEDHYDAAEPSGLEVENIALTYDASIQMLKMRYRVKITDHLIEHITGRTIAILKPGAGERINWLTLPEMPLDPAGRPVHWQKGQLFSISHFRDIVFEAKSQQLATAFTLATILVFSETGNLLLEKDVPLTAEQD